MKISRNFRKISKLANAINAAKNEAKNMTIEIDDEREKLDVLESEIKGVLKI